MASFFGSNIYSVYHLTLTMKTYFKKKKEAISLISNVLWGFTSKNSNDVCDMLIEHTEKTVIESTVKLL